MNPFAILCALDEAEDHEGERLISDCPEWAQCIAHLIVGMPPYNRLEQIATAAQHGYKQALLDRGVDEKTATEQAGLLWSAAR